MSTNETPRDWLRGVLEPCLLALLAEGEAYGYDLAARLEAAGIGSIPGGTLYPALLRMHKHGLVVSEWRAGETGPGRKYYRLTVEGRVALEEVAPVWERFAGSVAAVLRAGVSA